MTRSRARVEPYRAPRIRASSKTSSQQPRVDPIDLARVDERFRARFPREPTTSRERKVLHLLRPNDHARVSPEGEREKGRKEDSD